MKDKINCEKHGMQTRISTGCVQCERDAIGPEGIEFLKVLMNWKAIGDAKSVHLKDVMNEVKHNLKEKNEKDSDSGNKPSK